MTFQAHIEPDKGNPRSCNTGVPECDPPTKHPKDFLRFDWYQASFIAQIDDVEALFIRDFGGEFLEDKGRHSYEFGSKHTELAVFFMWGGQNQGIYIQASGSDAEFVADWVRHHFPDHKVSRADVCLDFEAAGSFERLAGTIEPIARKARTSVTLIGDPDPTTMRGRTFYYGSRKTSDVFIRLYEKGLEQIGKGNETANPDWVRFEAVFKPRKDRKALAAKWSKAEFFQMSKWVNETANQVVGIEGVYQPDPSLRKNSDDLALEHMLNQYGNLLKRQVEKRGWQSLTERMFITLFTPKERAAFEKDPSGLEGRGEKETVSRSHHKGP